MTLWWFKNYSLYQGAVIRKVWYDFLDNSQALTMAITDIKDNYEFYRERYLKWLKGN
ncbi:MAG: hypothetical protein WC855_02590 [Thermodesulfovibrionales bacterium]